MFWEDTKEVKGHRIEFDGTPFFLLATKLYDCQHGQDRNAALKARLQELRRQKQVKIKCTVITSIMLRLIHIDKYSMEQGIKSVHLTYLN